ncbi:hypothetical protein H8959_015909 [Pygathrix nigripes]
MLWKLLLRSQSFRLCSFKKMQSPPKYRPFLACFTYKTDTQSSKENTRTVEKLYKFSVDIRKIRRLKGWVLLEDKTYVEEIASTLQELGADETAVASILERCPEAIVCSPTAVNTQRKLWQLVCKNEEELIKLIQQFPESFFTIKDQENQKLNVQLFQELELKNVVISRLLTTASNVFHNPVEKNKQMIVQYRIRKLNSLGYRIKDGHLANLNGSKKEFEANFGKIQAKKVRPLFNPVAPLNVEE